jgi:hypothetical protein
VAGDEGSEPPDARTLQQRIDRLDETLARISAMLPLLSKRTRSVIPSPDDLSSAPDTLRDLGR